MLVNDPKTYLWSNICFLMKSNSPTVDAVQVKTKVGRGTVQRIKEGQTSIGTDTLLAIADAFNIELWQLLQPDLKDKDQAPFPEQARPPLKPESNDSLIHALEVVEQACASLAPVLLQPSRDELARWARGESSAAETATTLSAYAKASASLPKAPPAVRETVIKEKAHRDET